MHDRQVAMGKVVEDANSVEVLEAITGATSQDPTIMQMWSKRLTELQLMNGYFDTLHEIASQKSIPLYVRQQAIIQFKNKALESWRSRRLLTEDQRFKIRSRSLEFIEEEDDGIANINAYIIGKISRNDYPNSWPNLVPDIIMVIDSKLQVRYSSTNGSDPHTFLLLRRSLQILNSILKEFSGFKMLSGVKVMAQMIDKIREPLQNYYIDVSKKFSPAVLTPESIKSRTVLDDITIGHLILKCITKMGSWVWNRVDKSGTEYLSTNLPWLQALFSHSAVQLKTLADIRRQIILSGSAVSPQAQDCIIMLTKHICLFGKFFKKLSIISHQRFVELPMCSDLVLYYWSLVVDATNDHAEYISESLTAPYPVRILVQGMSLFKDNLSQWTPLRRDGTPNPKALSKLFIQDAVRLVISRFMPLKPKDLQKWLNDPEAWLNSEDIETDQWEYEIRGCSERVLISMANHFSSFVAPLLVSTFQDLGMQPASTLESVIQKEALYCALGRCCNRVRNDIPYQAFIEQTLSVEAQSTDPSFPIIKRRIAWLIGKWVSGECISPNTNIVWGILSHLLHDRGQGSDIVVRLSAAMALRECIDIIMLDVDIFVPHLSSIVSDLVTLISEVDTMECKRRVAYTLNTVIQQVGAQIAPYATVITQPLPQLWFDADEDWLFKCTLLVTITHLIQAMKGDSTSLVNIIVPLVRESMTPGPSKVNLDEDGYSLWAAALQNIHTLNVQSINGPTLIELFPLVMSDLGENLDLLGKTTDVLQSYFLLDAEHILQLCAVNLFRTFLSPLEKALPVNRKDLLGTLNLLIQLTTSVSWGEAMHTSGLFANFLKTLFDPKGTVSVQTEQLLVFSRMILSNRNMFVQLLSATASAQGVDESHLVDKLLDAWWARFDNMSEPRHRKLCVMGIASLCSTGRLEVVRRLPTELFNMFLDVLGEIKEAQVDEPLVDEAGSPISSPYNLRRHWELDEAPHEYYRDTEGTLEYDRRKALYDKDPVRTVQLATFISQCIEEAIANSSPGVFQEVISKADPNVVVQITNELRLPI